MSAAHSTPHKTRHARLVAALAAAALMAGTAAQAATAWDESVNGDLSNSGLEPSFAALVAGSNELRGTTGRAFAGGPVDRDYLHVTVPAGHVLQALTVLTGTTTFGGGSFIGLQAGPQVTLPVDTFSAAGLLGWTLYGPDQIGADILGDMSLPANGSSGFEIPLPAGSYTLWIQETGVGSLSYAFDLSVVAVPEAPTAGMLLAGLALLAGAMRRR